MEFPLVFVHRGLRTGLVPVAAWCTGHIYASDHGAIGLAQRNAPRMNRNSGTVANRPSSSGLVIFAAINSLVESLSKAMP